MISWIAVIITGRHTARPLRLCFHRRLSGRWAIRATAIRDPSHNRPVSALPLWGVGGVANRGGRSFARGWLASHGLDTSTCVLSCAKLTADTTFGLRLKGMGLAVSPNGGSARERQRLVDRFGDRLTVNPELTRKAVSYQGNRRVPGLRWLKYKEGFSRTLVEHMLEDFRPASVLDPFAGIRNDPSHCRFERYAGDRCRDHARRRSCG